MSRCWADVGVRIAAALLVVFAAATPLVDGGVRVSPPAGTVASGGGGPAPTPPNSLATLGILRVPTFINVTSGSSTGPWVVHVRDASGMLLVAGLTDGSGYLTTLVPSLPGLRLDVIGTDAVDVPIKAGATVEIWLP